MKTHANATLQGLDFYHFVTKVAECLGSDWTIDEPSEDYGGRNNPSLHSLALLGPNDMKIYIGVRGDKVYCSGAMHRICTGTFQQFHYQYSRGLSDVGVSWSRGALVVAKAIIDRLFPTYIAALQIGREEIVRHQQRLNDRLAIMKRLEQRFSIRWEHGYDDPAKFRATGHFMDQKDGSALKYADIEVSQNSVKIIKTNDMNVDIALKVLDILSISEIPE